MSIFCLSDRLVIDDWLEKHCTRASLHSDTVEDLIRISVEGEGWC